MFLSKTVGHDGAIAKVAVKLMIWDSKREKEQTQELELATTLKHDRLINFYESFITDVEGHSFLALVMELADYSLQNRLEQLSEGELLPRPERDQVIESVLEALCFLHGEGIVHRDIKPDNLLWVNGQWKVADFGISRILEEATSTNTNANNLSISYRYMPPEAVEGLISPHWDIWSLGILITLLITGEHPFPHTNIMELSWKIRHELPVFTDEINPLYNKIISSCLAKERYKRWNAKKLFSYFTIVRSSDNTEEEIAHFLNERLEEIEVLREHDDYRGIIALCKIILELKPDHYEAWYIKGEAYSCLDQYQEALDAYEHSISCNPHYAIAVHASNYIKQKIEIKSI
ncbi:protein kinase [Synechocystis sp. CS-94]|nr:putative serine/threonine protein kinase [Synechocystis sp. PCC 6714]MCT0253335.1 protein kinase [Synechocystis sp. CS-94]